MSVADLTADPERRADARFELVTRAATLNIGGRAMAGFTVNNTSPGPTSPSGRGS